MPKSKKKRAELYERFSLHYSDTFRENVEREFIEPDNKERRWISKEILSDDIRKKNYGANLRSLRERNGLSLEALGKSLNLSQTRIAQIEKADYKSEINPIYLKIFCFICSCCCIAIFFLQVSNRAVPDIWYRPVPSMAENTSPPPSSPCLSSHRSKTASCASTASVPAEAP